MKFYELFPLFASRIVFDFETNVGKDFSILCNVPIKKGGKVG